MGLKNLFLEEYKIYDNGSKYFKDFIDEIILFYKTINLNIKKTNKIENKIIIFNLVDISYNELPKDFIVYNLEQLIFKRKLPIINKNNINKFRRAKLILDYSKLNIPKWKEYKIDNVHFLPEPLIYLNNKEKININNNIIFYGHHSYRRKLIINFLKKNNINIFNTLKLFNKKKTEILKNFNIIFDCLSYTPGIKNILRISESLKHNCLIISEDGVDEYYNKNHGKLSFNFKNSKECLEQINKLFKLTDEEKIEKIKNNFKKAKEINNIIREDTIRILNNIKI